MAMKLGIKKKENLEEEFVPPVDGSPEK